MKDIYTLKIRSLEAAAAYRHSHGMDDSLHSIDVVMYRSILTKYCIDERLVTVNGAGFSYDFINVRFSYGVRDAMTAAELRTEFYNDGLEIEWGSKKNGMPRRIRYRMLFRTPGKSKAGEAIFVRAEIHKRLRDFMTMKLYDRMPDDNADIVSLSAYSSLISGQAAEGFMSLPLESILVIRDTESKSMHSTQAVSVENGHCVIDGEPVVREVSNVLWDGMGLIDLSIFPESANGFVYLRSHFFKSCLFPCKMQDYIREHWHEEYIADMFGNRLKASEIRAIVSDKSLKWVGKLDDLMDYQYWRNAMKESGDLFAIVKTAHHSKWGDLQKGSYQIFNSLPTADEEQLGRIAQASVDFCNSLKTDTGAYLDFLRRNATYTNIHAVIIALSEHNPGFMETEYFRRKRQKIISDFKTRKLMMGKLLQPGDNLTLCGNPLAMLMKACGMNPLDDPSFKARDDAIECHAPRFADGELLAGFRSPHNSSGNIVAFRNTCPEELMRYFPSLGENVIAVNGIGTDIQSRLNGCDYDTDFAYVTSQPDMAELARDAYRDFPTVINAIPSLKCTYRKDMDSFAKMDSRLAKSQMAVGRSTNVAQLALSFFFEDGTDERLMQIASILAVLAQVIIDSAKNTFDVDFNAEIVRLDRMMRDCVGNDPIEWPVFFHAIQKDKNRNASHKKKLMEPRKVQCPMDILAETIDREVLDSIRETPARAADLLVSGNPARFRSFKKICDLVKEYQQKLSHLDSDDEDYIRAASAIHDEYSARLKKYRLNHDRMLYLVRTAFASRAICDSLLRVLYDYDAEMFLGCFKKQDAKN